MKIIGLTGNSGCGKGSVAAIMAQQGAVILDCDEIAHSNMARGGIAYNDIVESFGSEILNANGEINRKALGNIVFNDKNKLELLNSITHKYITEKINEYIEKNSSKKCVVIDAPLLIEAGLEKCCDSVFAVYAPLETRVERIMLRDNIDRESALLRFKNQMDFEEIKKYADAVIVNDGSMEQLEKRVLAVMKNVGLI